MSGERSRREAVGQKRWVEQIAGKVPSERPACAIGAAQTRRETDDQQAGI